MSPFPAKSDSPLKIGAVLLNWNGGEFTIPCVESLLASEFKPWRILVFDNASGDGSQGRIARRFPQIQVIANPENLGFTGGNNAGIRELLRAGADLVWVLNNDTTVDPHCLGTLAASMDAEPAVAACTAKIMFERPADRIWYAGAFWPYWSLDPRHRGIKEVDRGQYDTPCDVGVLSGCCMLIRREAFEKVGLFKERYFAYSEDTEWCLRAARAGLRLRYYPDAVIRHKQHSSMIKNFGGIHPGKSPPRAEYLQVRNRLFMVREHARIPWQWLCAILLFSGKRIYRSLGLLLLRRWRSSAAIWKGLYDGLTKSYD